jgi:hypothetical protein
MGLGRGRAVAAAGLGALALAVAGCGAEVHPNEQRPQPPTRVSVSITPRAITVQPTRIAIGPEPTQQIPQNREAGQPPVRTNAPLDVVFVSANLTDFDSKLIVNGPRNAVSGPLVANGNGSLLASLPTGIYRLRAAGVPSAEPVRFTVGPVRTSSENDLLLP